MYFDNLPKGGFVCAHRGACSIAPENTLLAMRKARECGAHSWETDVRMSKDDELIIFHYPTLESTTDISTRKTFKDRTPWSVNQFTAAELRELDAGSWFITDDPFGTIASGEVSLQDQKRIRGQKIPMLHEVLDFTSRHRFPVNLEIKDLETPPGDVIIVDKIMDMIQQTETADLVLLSSFRYEYLYRARELDRTISMAMLAKEQHPPDLLRKLGDFSATAYYPDAALCDPSLIRELQRANYRITPWTVNDITRANKMLQAGMGVITDWPQRLTQMRDKRRTI